MNKQPKSSVALTAAGMLIFMSGAIAWVLLATVFTGYERFAIPAAAILAIIGIFVLIFNAAIHPDSIPRLDVRPPEINVSLPTEIDGYHRPRTEYTRANVETPHRATGVWPYRSDGNPLTKKQRIYATSRSLLWIATIAVYMLVSFITGRWEITWTIFLGAAFLQALLWLLFSIGGWD